MIGNKRGSTFIEATVVIPIVIMIFFSMVLYTIYQYENVVKQVDLHINLTQTVAQNNHKGIFFTRVKKNDINSINLGGITSGFLKKRISCKKYSFDFCRVTRCKNAIAG